MKKHNFIIIGLAILLLGALLYIGIGNYKDNREQKQLEVFQQGAQYGYEQAVVGVMNIASSCEVVPLTSGNFSINLVAVECLQQGESQ